jgi:hypothetical protein
MKTTGNMPNISLISMIKKTRRFGFPPLVYNFAKERTKHAWKAKDSDGF